MHKIPPKIIDPLDMQVNFEDFYYPWQRLDIDPQHMTFLLPKSNRAAVGRQSSSAKELSESFQGFMQDNFICAFI